ncbi:Glycosyl transferase, family 2 [Candidatus Sulfotelmatobacter sp. SbA7]|jgi:glycosyltransferase involved in cell wall biosynthesis|nr:Glycosyl transferase, family 2 [Candidatus Sulfotelmatobacter sp. SbA7]
MMESEAVAERPAVSVIVPARNEEGCLAACLGSLVGQAGAGVEIFVVDDGSTDRTREIAESFAGVRVVDAGPLPAGWSGKNNALTAGVRQAKGEWLLFTDADTVHRPGSLARALAEARAQGAALLSYSPEQEVHGFWERAVMPVIFAELAGRYRPAEVSDPRSMVAAANGQYLLISREAYEAVGGHAAIAGDLLDDVALARAVKRSGRRIFFRFGGDAVRTRMYRSFGQLREGWTKNLALLFPSAGRLAVLRLMEFGLIVGSGVVAGRLDAKDRAGAAIAMGLLCATLYGLFLKRILKAHFSWISDVLAVIGLPMFSYLLLRSKVAHREGKVSWKGREYGSGEAVAMPEDPAKAVHHVVG